MTEELDFSNAAATEKPSQRTVRLVKESIKLIKTENGEVSLQNIVSKSKLVDSVGVSVSALIRNEVAYSLYMADRKWRPKSNGRKPSSYWRTEINHLKTVRDITAKRRRLLQRYTKVDLVGLVIELQGQNIDLEAAIVSYAAGVYEAI
jgi:hypothetical protein